MSPLRPQNSTPADTTTTTTTTTTTMSTSTSLAADLDAIGAHCQLPSCHRLDFLPFRCPSCSRSFCLAHRTQSAHACASSAAAATNTHTHSSASTAAAAATPAKPTIRTHDTQCPALSCKTLVRTPLAPGVDCPGCGRCYCLKHRMREHHDCANVPRQPGANHKDAGAAGGAVADALARLRAWGAARKATTRQAGPAALPTATPSSAGRPGALPLTSRPTSSASPALALATLKRTAKGDAKIPAASRIHVHIEAVSEGLRADTNPRAAAFYAADCTVGRVLDGAAAALGVSNVNNRGGGEDERLRVFHVEGGRVLGFAERLGRAGAGVASGDTLVLLRGVGPPAE